MARTGRPRANIDWETFDKLCAMQCTKREIADFLEISQDTIERSIKREFQLTFAAYFEQKAAKGRISLRRKQFEIAQSGNVTMLIWLGKQYLQQAEKFEHTGKDGGPQVILTLPANGSEAQSAGASAEGGDDLGSSKS